MAEYEVGPDGFIVKTDVHDLGARMRPAPAGWVHNGPENAYDANTRGDYTGRRLPRSGWRRSTTNVFGERVVAGRGDARHG